MFMYILHYHYGGSQLEFFHGTSEFLGLLDSPCNNGANGDYT